MKKKDFIHLTIGQFIFSDELKEIREVHSQLDPEWTHDESIIFTRNALLRGSDTYDSDRMDIMVSDHPKWKKYTSFEDVGSRELREKIMMYELRIMKSIIYYPNTVSVDQVNHFI